MKILTAELVTSASADGPRDGVLRDDLPQFAFIGRSNVGKSSLLNALVRQKLARTSAAAGKTRQANIYRVTADGGPGGPGPWGLYLVDLPGYGYARGGHPAAEELATVVDAYFAAGQRRQPAPHQRTSRGAVFLLVDSRHPGLQSDRQAHEWMGARGAVAHLVATKVDKLSRSDRTLNLRELERLFGQAPLPVSTTTGEGLDQLWRVIASLARSAED